MMLQLGRERGASPDPEFIDRFRTEARITAGLNHAGIAAVYDYGEVADSSGRSGTQAAWLVMELVEGRPLSAVLQDEGRLPAARVLRLRRPRRTAARGTATARGREPRRRRGR